MNIFQINLLNIFAVRHVISFVLTNDEIYSFGGNYNRLLAHNWNDIVREQGRTTLSFLSHQLFYDAKLRYSTKPKQVKESNSIII